MNKQITQNKKAKESVLKLFYGAEDETHLAALAINEFRACLYDLRSDCQIGKQLHSWLACATRKKLVLANIFKLIKKSHFCDSSLLAEDETVLTCSR